MRSRFLLTIILGLFSFSGISQYTIPIPTNKPFNSNFINMSGFGSQDVRRLFDGNVNTGINSNGAAAPLALPWKGMVVLDSIYNITQLTWLNSNSNNSVFSARFYNASRTQIGDSVSFTITGYFDTFTISAVRNGVRFVEIRCYTQDALFDGLGEIRLTGTSTGVASSIMPTVTPDTSVADVGVRAIGINEIGDRINKINISGDTVLKFATRSFRTYPLRAEWDYSPDIYDAPMVQSPLWLGRFATNNSKLYYDKVKRWGSDMTFSSGNGTVKGTTTPYQSNSPWPGTFTYNWYHYTERNAPLENDTSWKALGRLYGNLAALYGPNSSALLTATVIGGDATKGQNQLSYMETGNEENRDWVTEYYLNPRKLYVAHRAIYDSVKLRTSALPVHLAALPGLNYEYWKAIIFEHYWATGGINFPTDGVNFNNYVNNSSGQGGGGTVAISPEQWMGNTALVDSFFRIYFSGKPATWSEYGYATDDVSPYDVDPIGGKTAREVQADWETRLKAVVQARSRVINRMQNYAVFEDGTDPFNSMAMLQDNFTLSVYTYSTVFPKAYAQANEIYAEQNYKWFATIIQSGDSTGTWVTRKDHLSDANKKLIKVWRGTRNGSTASQLVTVSGAVSAKMFTMRYDRFVPDSTVLTVTAGQFTVPATESMSWIETSTVAAPPVANAGADQSITTSTATLTGSGVGSGSTIVGYLWTKISGIGGNITSQTSATTGLTGLNVGTYVFRLTVTDNLGATATDDIQVIVGTSAAGLKINSGGPLFTNSGTETWTADQYFGTSSTSTSYGTAIAGTTRDSLYQADRYAVNLTYSIPVSTGQYLVRLHFAETFFASVGSRIMNISIEGGQGVLNGYDIFASVGYATADVKTFSGITVTDGTLNISLTGTADQAKICGIEVIQVNIPPTVNAGTDQTISITTVSLSGTASDTDGTIASYAWTKISGTGGTIASPSSSSTSVTGLSGGSHAFRLFVTDNQGGTRDDTLNVTVSNTSPTANAGADQSITLPTSQVTLTGSGSDPGGSIASYAWTKLTGTGGTVTSPSSATTTFTGLSAGTYTLRLLVTDNLGATAADTVQITVNASTPPPASGNVTISEPSRLFPRGNFAPPKDTSMPAMRLGELRHHAASMQYYRWNGTIWMPVVDTVSLSTKANAQKVVNDTAKVLRSLVASSTALSGITGATAFNSINHGNNSQVWTWNKPSSYGLYLGSQDDSISTGFSSLLALSRNGVSASGSSGTNIGIITTVATTGGATNAGAIFGALGATTNYALTTTTGKILFQDLISSGGKFVKANALGQLYTSDTTASSSISALIAATSANTLNNADNTQTWQWNSLTSNGLTLSSTSTTGAAANNVLNIIRSGANASSAVATRGISSVVSNTGAASINYGAFLVANSGSENYGVLGGSNTSNGVGVYGIVASGSGGTGVKGFVGGTGTTYAVYGDNIGSGTAYGGYFTGSIGGYFTGTSRALVTPAGGGNVGFGTESPSSKAIVEMASTSQGFLPPRMTTTERNNITSPPAGLMVYDTTVNKVSVYNGTSWRYLSYE
jgi:hypothetical protein